MKLAIRYRPRNKRDKLPWVVCGKHHISTLGRCATSDLAMGVVRAYLREKAHHPAG